MKIPNDKIKKLQAEVEKRTKEPVVSTEVQGAGEFCPHCNSMKLHHNNCYPRFTGDKIIMMTRCLDCGMLFDEPKKSDKPYVVFKTATGKVIGCELEKADIE